MHLLVVTAALSLAANLALPSLAAVTPSPYPVSVTQSNGPPDFGFTRVDAQTYTATVYVNGVPYQLVLDSGSSDTWIDPWSLNMSDPPSLIQTGYNSTSTYVDGTVSTGPIVLADVAFGPYTIKNQAITVSYNASKHGQYNGIIGLGGAFDSHISSTLANTSFADNAIPVIYNLFKGQPDLPNYVTWLMSRSEVGINSGGILTISDVLADMTDIFDAPSYKSVFPGQWTTVLDGIYVNGKFVTAQTKMSPTTLDSFNISLPDNSVLATFDTGSSLILGPRAFADAVYKNIPGAHLAPPDGSNQTQYIIPCNSKVNVTWSFGGNLYPMHPIDAVYFYQASNGTFMCFGSIMGGEASGTEDILLGDIFLTNAYQLYDYGTLDSSSMPSVRLLSTTDADEAWAETDSLNLARIVSHEEYWVSTAAAPTSVTGIPVYTGASGSAPSLTTIFNNGTWTPTATPISTTVVVAQTVIINSDSVSQSTGPAIQTGTAAAGVSGDAQADVRLAGAVAEDATTPKALDLSTLTRNSYIILGLLVVALVMLLAVAVMLAKTSRGNTVYRAVPSGNLGRETKPFTSESDSFYSTPYDSHS
ncbi:aspartic peptidase domain-containing protein [Lenzites betulinus]|nr:aspartic peptidase domain-containing protein [Lenzites betulinus]